MFMFVFDIHTCFLIKPTLPGLALLNFPRRATLFFNFDFAFFGLSNFGLKNFFLQLCFFKIVVYEQTGQGSHNFYARQNRCQKVSKSSRNTCWENSKIAKTLSTR
jgi:hypothetical protein